MPFLRWGVVVNSLYDWIEVPEVIQEDIDDLKRMKQWKSLMGALLEIRRDVMIRLGRATNKDDVLSLAAEYRAIVKITEPLLMPPVDRD